MSVSNGKTEAVTSNNTNESSDSDSKRLRLSDDSASDSENGDENQERRYILPSHDMWCEDKGRLANLMELYLVARRKWQAQRQCNHYGADEKTVTAAIDDMEMAITIEVSLNTHCNRLIEYIKQSDSCIRQLEGDKHHAYDVKSFTESKNVGKECLNTASTALISARSLTTDIFESVIEQIKLMADCPPMTIYKMIELTVEGLTKLNWKRYKFHVQPITLEDDLWLILTDDESSTQSKIAEHAKTVNKRISLFRDLCQLTVDAFPDLFDNERFRKVCNFEELDRHIIRHDVKNVVVLACSEYNRILFRSALLSRCHRSLKEVLIEKRETLILEYQASGGEEFDRKCDVGEGGYGTSFDKNNDDVDDDDDDHDSCIEETQEIGASDDEDREDDEDGENGNDDTQPLVAITSE